MSLMENFMNVLNLKESDEDLEQEYMDDIDEPTLSDQRNMPKERIPASSISRLESENTDKRSKFNANSQKSSKLKNGMEVCVIKPTQFEDATEVIDTLLSNRPVILNMEGLNTNIAQRIFDVVAGGTYAIDGKLQKIANSIFILTPHSVDISGDFQTILSESF